MHFPHPALRGRGGGEAMPRCSAEPGGVADAEIAFTFEGHRAAYSEQVQVNSVGQFNGGLINIRRPCTGYSAIAIRAEMDVADSNSLVIDQLRVADGGRVERRRPARPVLPQTRHVRIATTDTEWWLSWRRPGRTGQRAGTRRHHGCRARHRGPRLRSPAMRLAATPPPPPRDGPHPR